MIDRSYFEKFERIIIYGAGFYGQSFLKWLYRQEVFQTIIFVESIKGKQNKVMGWPCLSLDELSLQQTDCLIVAVKKENESAILSRLSENRMQPNIVISDEIRRHLADKQQNVGCNTILELLKEDEDKLYSRIEELISRIQTIDEHILANWDKVRILDVLEDQGRVINKKIDDMFSYLYEFRDIYNKNSFEESTKIGNIQYLSECIVDKVSNVQYVSEKTIEKLGNVENEFRTNSRRTEIELGTLIEREQFSKDIAISVLVPVCNTEKYLKECLCSLQKQVFSNFEVVVINDGSTDSSETIIEEYVKGDSRFRVINKNNTGYGHSMNMGIEAARGEYIAILESDDWATPNMLKSLFECAYATKADVVLANYNTYDVLKKKSDFTEELWQIDYWKQLDFEQRTILCYGTPAIWRGIYKKNFLEKNEIKFLESPGASYQDVDFFFKVVASVDNIYAIPNAVINYRCGHTTASIASTDKVYCICDEFHEIERYLKSRGLGKWEPVRARALFKRYKWNLERLQEPQKTEFFKCFKKELGKLDKQGKLCKSFWNEEEWEEMQIIKNE